MVSQLRGNFPLQLYFAIVMSDANWGIDRPVRQSSSFLAPHPDAYARERGRDLTKTVDAMLTVSATEMAAQCR
jgi:hypothetical protein